MQSIGPATAGHHASGEFVDDDDLAVFDHVLHVAAIKRVRFNRSLNVMLERPVLRISNIPDAEQSLNLRPAFVRDSDIAMLLINHEVASELRRLPRSNVDLFSLFELGDDAKI